MQQPEPGFAVVLPRRPVSLQTSGRSKQYFQAAVAHAATAVRPAALLLGPLYLRVVWFCTTPSGDVDNIIKPIGDALKKIVYEEDNVVAKVASERVIIRTSFDIADDGASARAVSELLVALKQGHPDVVYIEVGDLLFEPRRRVCLGPIDRRA